MSTLQTLEAKVTALLSLVQKLKEENYLLSQENQHLGAQIEQLEAQVLKHGEHFDTLNQEKEATKHNVNELIKIIDSFIEAGKTA